MIIRLKNTHIDEACVLLEEAGRHLAASGIDQWDDKYPARSDVEKDIADDTAFGAVAGGRLVAYMVLNRFNDEEYKDVFFRCSDESSLTLHRLAVHPDYQGRGIAGHMVDFAEGFALEKGMQGMRLDAYSLNPAALSLYENRGYLRRGSVRFRKGVFHLYEKLF